MTIILLNLVLDLCSLIIILITLYGVLFESRENTLKNKLFKYIVRTTLLCILVDLSSFYFIFTAPGGTGWYITSFLAAIPPFFWVALVMFYLLSIIRETKPVSWRIGWLFTGLDALAVIIGVIYGLRGEAFAWVDNHFEAGFMGVVVFLFNVFFLLLYGAVCFYYRHALGTHNSIALFMYLLIPMTGLCIDAYFIGIYSLLFCITISVLLCFVMIQHRDLVMRTEQLTEQNEVIERGRLKLELAINQAEAANQAKTLFLNNMSHDIRTPMNAVLGFTELIEHNLDNREALVNYVSKIKVSGNYVLNLINNLLDMARIESGKVELDEQVSDISKAADTILPLFEDTVRKKNQTIETQIDIRNRYVMLDKVKMQQIAVNLVSNAVKYTPEGGWIRFSLSEQPAAETSRARYIFEVSDNGIGMSPEFVEHVFDHFSRERNTTDSKVMGTGLGMSIVKKLVELMGGKISVNSQLGKGTTFTIEMELPLVQNPEACQQPEDKPVAVHFKAEGRRLLLAEDNELNAEIATALLEEEGIAVDHAWDGMECVRMLTEAPSGYYDLILMDVQMPNLNGYEAAGQIRALSDARKASVPIIAVTANAFEEDRKMAHAAGMNGHLVKPIDPAKLIGLVSQYFTTSTT